MSMSIPIATAAVAQSAAATAAANHAEHVARCAVVMPNYTHTTATVEQAQEYAECVRLLHPVEHDYTGARLVVGILILFALAGAAIGAWYDGFVMAVAGALAGLAVGLGVLLLLSGIAFVIGG